MKKIYIIDYLGEHSGVKYYLNSFKDSLQENKDFKVEILSNYSESEEPPFFKNHYKGRIFRKLYNLGINIYRLYKQINSNIDNIYIYESYGTRLDIPFIRIISKAPNHVIDIHEAIAQNKDENALLLNIFHKIYKKSVKTAISHSERTNTYLKSFNYPGKLFIVPHFKYNVDSHYSYDKVSSEVIEAIDPERVNLLFFGNISKSKGIDILFEALNLLSSRDKSRINLIVAGKDFDKSIDLIKLDNIKNVRILRFISDDEMKYLYTHSDFVTLPYRKTSQSGIVEMSFNFKKPIIASNIPYFNKILSEFPSFGILSSSIEPRDFVQSIKIAIEKKLDHALFFYKDDYDQYTKREEITIFYKDFNSWIYQQIESANK